MEREDFLSRRIRELANTSYQRGIGTFSDFLTLSEQDLLYRLSPLKNFGVYTFLWGGYEQAERCMAGFWPASDIDVREGKENLSFDDHGICRSDPAAAALSLPACWVMIEASAPKFAQKLSHRDYLGSVLGLGLERSVIGDILAQEHSAFVYCDEKIASFLIRELTQVSRTNVSVRQSGPELLPQAKKELLSGTVASVRLDSLVAFALSLSRSEAAAQIEAGHAYVNGRLIQSVSFVPKEGDAVSVRHKGKFLFTEEKGKTKKGRCGITVEKFV